MSPLFASEFCAALAPGRIELTRRAAGPGRRTEAYRWASLEPAGGETGQWEFALSALETMLGAEPPVRGRLKVVLSSHWVRYLIIPWNDAIQTPAEFALYARACAERVHGEIAAEWEIRVDPAAAGQPRVACAVDRALVEVLSSLCEAAHCKLAGVQPYLMHAFNPLHSGLARKDFLFVLAEPGRVTLLAAAAGAWRSVRNTAFSGSGEALEGLIERELQLFDGAGRGAPEIIIHAPRFASDELPDCELKGWRLVPPGGSSGYAMAWGTGGA